MKSIKIDIGDFRFEQLSSRASESNTPIPILICKIIDEWIYLSLKEEESLAKKKSLAVERQRRYRERHPERVKENDRQASQKYYQANKEKAAENRKRRYGRNPEKYREYQRQYATANKDKVLESQRKHREAKRQAIQDCLLEDND